MTSFFVSAEHSIVSSFMLSCLLKAEAAEIDVRVHRALIIDRTGKKKKCVHVKALQNKVDIALPG